MQALSSELYSQAKASGGKAGGPAGEPPPDASAQQQGQPAGGAQEAAGAKAAPEGDVIDADFTMVDDDKKKK